MRLTRNIYRHEIECPCGCDIDTFDYETADVLQGCVDHFQAKYKSYNVGIHINSGNRCAEYNATIEGSSPKSMHTQFRAADFYLYDKNAGNAYEGVRIHDDEIADYLEATYPNKYGIGRYKGRTHFDSRAVKARWDNR